MQKSQLKPVLKLSALLALLMLAGYSVVHAAGSGLVVTLAASANLQGKTSDTDTTTYYIKLADIAELSGEAKLIQQVEGEWFGRVPEGSVPKTLSVGEIREQLLRAGISSRQLEFRGADSIKIYNKAFAPKASEKSPAADSASEKEEAASESASAEAASTTDSASKEGENNIAEQVQKQIASREDEATKEQEARPAPVKGTTAILTQALDAIQRDVARQLTLSLETVRVTTVRMNRPLELIAYQLGALTQCDPVNRQQTPLGEHAWLLAGQIGDAESTGLVLTVKIERLVKVYVASRDLKRGDELTEDNLSLEERGFTTKNDSFFSDLESLAFLAAKKSVKTGEVITPNDVEAAIVIKRGGKARITISFGGVTAIVPEAIATADGRLGEEIQFKYDFIRNDGKKDTNYVIARVTGPGAASKGE